MVSNEIQNPPRFFFPISDVQPASERLPEITVRAALERTAQTQLLTCPKAEQRVIESGNFHPLIASAAIAYQQHYPLVLSPDIIWLTILQGVAQHIANHHETLRSRLVSHQTKIELVVGTNPTKIPERDCEMLSATQAFVELVGKHVQPDKQFLLRTEFSTTTDVERIVGAVVLMDAFQPYFDYVFSIICGIPSVSLEGTPSDWKLLAAKVQLLHESDLDLSWWTCHLLPLCNQFVQASHGNIDRDHWQNLCKLVARYGVDDLNGWLLKFIPYIRKEKNEVPIHRNPVLELTSYNGDPEEPDRESKITGCTSDMLPTGVSRVPMVCQNISTGENVAFQFLAGLVGVSHSDDDLSIRAVVGWAIAEPTSIDALIDKLRTQHGCVAPTGLENEVILRLFDRNLPGDMWKFYSEIDEAHIGFPQPNKYGETSCSIFGFYVFHSGPNIKRLWDCTSVKDELTHLCQQGIISKAFLEDRVEFVYAYANFLKLASARTGTSSAYYVYGQLPDSDARIFRWTGQHTPEAFTPVAKTFTEWLTTILDSAQAMKSK